MVELTIRSGSLRVEMLGWHKLFAFKSRLEIPTAHIVAVRRAHEPGEKSWWRRWRGWRLGGTGVPGVIAAGWHYLKGKHVFYDVVHPDKCVEIDLKDEGYSQLVVEVADPALAIRLLEETVRNRI